MPRLIAGFLVALALVGCGESKSHSQRYESTTSTAHLGTAWPGIGSPRSVTEVKTAFARHRIRLTREASGITSGVRFQTLVARSGDPNLIVEVYRSAPRYYSVLLAGTGKTHTLIARNVLAAWKGHDSPRVRAAINELK